MAEKMTYASALAGRGKTLAAIGFGSLGTGDLCAQRLGYAIPCLLVALALTGRLRTSSWGRGARRIGVSSWS